MAGFFGDVLLQRSGMHPIFAPVVHQRQAMQNEEPQRQRRRMEGREDAEWEWQNRPKESYVPDAEKQAQY